MSTTSKNVPESTRATIESADKSTTAEKPSSPARSSFKYEQDSVKYGEHPGHKRQPSFSRDDQKHLHYASLMRDGSKEKGFTEA
jgi:hypothetical protein